MSTWQGTVKAVTTHPHAGDQLRGAEDRLQAHIQGRIQGGTHGARASHQEGASHQFAAGALFNLSV